MVKTVIKRDGTKEPFLPEKMHHWAYWADSKLGANWNDILDGSTAGMPEEVTTSELQDSLIDYCVSMRDPMHVKMATRLLLGSIYKDAYGGIAAPPLGVFYKKMVSDGYWRDAGYNDADLEILDSAIDHKKDFSYSYPTLKQFKDKYAVSAYGRCMESPQMAIMAIAMSNVSHEEDKVIKAINLYKTLSNLLINLPTPSLNGERTNMAASPSCCVISGGDDAESMHAVDVVAYSMTCNRSGIGAEKERRSPGDPVKGGIIKHQGAFHYIDHLRTAVKANKQISRGGSATFKISCLDPEIMSLVRLKSQRTAKNFQIVQLDYSLAMNKVFLKAVADNDDWMLVSVYYAPKLYDLFYSGNPKAFKEEYDRVMADQSIKKKIIKACDLLLAHITEWFETGMNYSFFVDNVNQHTPFIEPVRLSNLCQEVCLPTKAYDNIPALYEYAESGEVALCFLGAMVVGNIESDAEYEEATYQLCKFIDNTIDNAVYPFASIEYTAKKRRSIGVGMTDVAHWMAKHGYQYDTEEGCNALHRLAERHSYYLHKASVRLAKERSHCEWMNRTKYANEQPWLPIDTYNKNIDKHHSQGLQFDWEELRKEIKEYGVRFSVHEAYMPVESSSAFTNSTNGVYPIREHQIFKKSPAGVVFFEAPEWDKLKESYQRAWEIDKFDMAKAYGIIQKFTGQSISSDFYHDYGKDKKVSGLEMIKLFLFADSIGMKTFYYMNSVDTNNLDGHYEVSQVEVIEDGCDSCKM